MHSLLVKLWFRPSLTYYVFVFRQMSDKKTMNLNVMSRTSAKENPLKISTDFKL